MAQEGDRVAVHYRGTLDSGEVFDSSREREQPIEFVVGSGEIISGFDNAVRDMTVGDTKKFRLEPGEAYGDHDPELVFQFPKDEAPEDLEEGDEVQFSNGAPGIVLEVTDESVIIDANHPLAGEALTFEIELVSVE